MIVADANESYACPVEAVPLLGELSEKDYNDALSWLSICLLTNLIAHC